LLATLEVQTTSVIANGAYDGRSGYDAAAAGQRNPLPHIVIPQRASSIVDTGTDTQTMRDRHVREVLPGREAWPGTTPMVMAYAASWRR